MRSSHVTTQRVFELPGLPFLFFVAVAVLTCLPALTTPASRVIGNIDHPGLQGELFHQSDMIANLRAGELSHAFASDRVAAPEGMDLREFTGFSLHLFLYLPLAWLDHLIVRHNLLAVLVLALNGYCAYLLGRYLTRQRLPALFCGVLFLLSPYALLKLDMGFLQKVSLWWIPLFLRDLLRFLDSRRRRHALLAGLAWALMLLTYAPYAWYAAWAAALLVGLNLLHAPDRTRRLLSTGWPAALPAVAAVVFLAASLPHGGGTPAGDGQLPLAMELAPVGSLDIAHLFRFQPYRGFMPTTDGLTLGLSPLAIILAGLAVLRRRHRALQLAAIGLFFLVIAIGPYPHVNGHVLARVPLPYALLAALPWGARLGFPIRALPFTEIAFAAMAAARRRHTATCERSARDGRSASRTFKVQYAHLLLPVLLLLAIPAERALLLPELFPPRATPAALPPELTWLKQQGGTVLHLPVNIKGSNVRRYLYITARTDTRMMNRYLNLHEGFPVPPFPHPSASALRAYLDHLRETGCDLIVVHPDLVDAGVHPLLLPPSGRRGEDYTTADTAVLRTACGPPVYSNAAGLIAYRVPDTPRPFTVPDTNAQPAGPAATHAVGDAEMRAYYKAHRDTFQRAKQIRVHHFFVPLAPEADNVQRLVAREEARRIEERIARSPAASLALAAQLTRDDPLGRRWGDIGYVARGCLPEDVDKVLFALDEIGRTVRIERNDGIHVFRLMDIRPPHEYAFEEVRTAIRDAMSSERGRTANREPRTSNVEGRQDVGARREARPAPPMVYVPGGEFWMGSTEDEIDAAYRMAQRFAGRVTTVRRAWFEDERYRRVRVRPFYMDRHEVTLAEYQAFREATGHRPLPEWVADVAPRDDMPVVGVSLDDARAYAAWAGKRLPTVEEWAWAARGAQRRRYPWGHTAPDGTRCNYADASTNLAWNDPAHDDGYRRLAPVGTYPAGATPHGILDLAGNVREWTATARLGVTDLRDRHIWTLPQQHRVPAEHRGTPRIMYTVRGGGWNNAADDMRCSDERMLPPATRDEALGFRCVRDARADVANLESSGVRVDALRGMQHNAGPRRPGL